jgi:RNA polymerase sigma factor (sigma-70 family)
LVHDAVRHDRRVGRCFPHELLERSDGVRKQAHAGLIVGRKDALTQQLLDQRTAFLRFLAAKVGPSAAEGILQSCYLKLVEKGPQVVNEESVVSWFYTVLRHATIDYYRRNAARDQVYEQFAAEAPISYEMEVKANICQCLLLGVLDTLKPEYRTALEAIDLNGQSIAEYANSAGTTPNNVGVRLHRARKATAKRMTQLCGTCAEHKCLDCTGRKPGV